MPDVSDARRLTAALALDSIMITPLINDLDPVVVEITDRTNPGKNKLPAKLFRLLRCYDMRGLPDVKGWRLWQLRFWTTGPGFDHNPLDLLAPSAILTAAMDPAGNPLSFKQLFDVGSEIGMDCDLSYVRVHSSLMNRSRLQAVADQSMLPNGEAAAGIVIRNETDTTMAIRVPRNKTQQKGQ